VSDSNVEAVIAKMRERADKGLSKYGVTTERDDLTDAQWLVHAQEEAMDLAVYLQRLSTRAVAGAPAREEGRDEMRDLIRELLWHADPKKPKRTEELRQWALRLIHDAPQSTPPPSGGVSAEAKDWLNDIFHQVFEEGDVPPHIEAYAREILAFISNP
jgi:hypothetical protein